MIHAVQIGTRQKLVLFVLLGAGFMLSVDWMGAALTVNVAVTLSAAVLIARRLGSTA